MIYNTVLFAYKSTYVCFLSYWMSLPMCLCLPGASFPPMRRAGCSAACPRGFVWRCLLVLLFVACLLLWVGVSIDANIYLCTKDVKKHLAIVFSFFSFCFSGIYTNVGDIYMYVQPANDNDSFQGGLLYVVRYVTLS